MFNRMDNLLRGKSKEWIGGSSKKTRHNRDPAVNSIEQAPQRSLMAAPNPSKMQQVSSQEETLPAVSTISPASTAHSSTTAISPPPVSQINQPTTMTAYSVTSSSNSKTSMKGVSNMRHVGILGVDKALLAESYYHGIVQRDEIEDRLERDGDFLVCIPDDTMHKQAVVAVAVKFSKVRFFVIGKTRKGRFHITEKCFDSIPLLIQHYMTTREPLNPQMPIVVKRAVPLPDYIITHDRIRLGEQIGKGAYGHVYKATLVCGQSFQVVAVKTFKGNHQDGKRLGLFLQEARAMRDYTHDNIVNFIGIASQQEPLMLVLEFCGGGCLLKHLRTNGPSLNVSTRFRFATEAAAGLRYLEMKKCIHRDIAARNCLLTDLHVCKISDFGLSIKQVDDFIEKSDDKLPIKWLAPEVIRYRQFSSKSDVWAYGILLYEIFTDGAEPYPNMSTAEVRAQLTGVTKYRMDIPLDVPGNIARIMTDCWDEDPLRRSTFKEIHKLLKNIKF